MFNNGSVPKYHRTQFILEFYRMCIFVVSEKVFKYFPDVSSLVTTFGHHGEKGLSECAIDPHDNEDINIVPWLVLFILRTGGTIKMTINSVSDVVGLERTLQESLFNIFKSKIKGKDDLILLMLNSLRFASAMKEKKEKKGRR